jgi:hypothetical protein
MKNKFVLLIASGLMMIAFNSCQKTDKPAFGDYLKDSNPPGGALNFYVAFDGTTADPLRNAVDSIRANFASDNPLTSTTGISGKAIKGEAKKFVKYAKPNDWAIKSESFTVSVWIKKDGQTKNNLGTNGPEYPFSFRSSNGHWSGGSMFLLLEGNNAACAVKMVVVDKNMGDNWFTWEGGFQVAGLLDNAWHHLALTYDAPTSTMKFYKDGVQNANLRTWGTHGKINIDNSAISELRLGAGPGTSYNTDDWLSSTWKGDLDQFRMYSTALTAAQISTLFTSKL